MPSAAKVAETTFDRAAASAARARALRGRLKFDPRKAFDARRANTARMMIDVMLPTQRGVAAAMRRMVDKGMTPATSARLIRSLIGLNERQAMAAMNAYDRWLEAGLNARIVERRVIAYASKLLKQRAASIAAWNTVKSVREGQKEAWRQAHEAGLVPERAREVWVAEATACDECEDLDGQEVRLGEHWDSDEHGPVDGPPVHLWCRCHVELVA